jgi:hypothetical protein
VNVGDREVSLTGFFQFLESAQFIGFARKDGLEFELAGDATTFSSARANVVTLLRTVIMTASTVMMMVMVVLMLMIMIVIVRTPGSVGMHFLCVIVGTARSVNVHLFFVRVFMFMIVGTSWAVNVHFLLSSVEGHAIRAR